MCSVHWGVDPVSLVTSPEPLGRGGLGGLVGRGRGKRQGGGRRREKGEGGGRNGRREEEGERGGGRKEDILSQ